MSILDGSLSCSTESLLGTLLLVSWTISAISQQAISLLFSPHNPHHIITYLHTPSINFQPRDSRLLFLLLKNIQRDKFEELTRKFICSITCCLRLIPFDATWTSFDETFSLFIHKKTEKSFYLAKSFLRVSRISLVPMPKPRLGCVASCLT